MKLWLDNWLEENKNNQISVMHIAPEGIISELIKSYSNIRYIKGDILNNEYKHLYGNDVYNIDVQDINWKDNNIDLFICVHVLEHVEDDIKALKEIYRVLKDKGKALLMIPYSTICRTDNKKTNNNKEREEYFGQHDHVRLYGYDFSDILRSIGFELEEYLADEYAARLLGLNPNEKLFVVTKPAVN